VANYQSQTIETKVLSIIEGIWP